jgi:hypothetical protein
MPWRCLWRAPWSTRTRVRALAYLAFAWLIGGVFAHPVPARATPPRSVAQSDPFAAFIAEASQRFGIPTSWIRAVMNAESADNVHAVSPKGAMGLMQIMPDTWAGLRARYGLGANPYDPHDNILAGAAYLRELHDRYGTAGFLAAYNAGPARYEASLATGRPLPDETRAYVAGLSPLVADGAIGDTIPAAVAASSWTASPLFAVRANSTSTSSRPSADRERRHASAEASPQDWTALAPQSTGLFVRISARSALR